MRWKSKTLLVWMLAVACTILLAKMTKRFLNKRNYDKYRIKEFIFEDLTVRIIGGDDLQGVPKRKSVFVDETCNVPRLEVNQSEIVQFMTDPSPLNCSEYVDFENWVYIENGKVKLKEERASAKCVISYFHRESDKVTKYEKPEILPMDLPMRSDFGKVVCTDKGTKWQGFLMSAVRNEKVVERAKKTEGGRVLGIDRLSVAILSFDSMSQQHFRRKLPSTVAQLEKMGAVIMNGYNIVGDGTPQAFIPILTGKNEIELPNARKRYDFARQVDKVFPFVWNKFSNSGYVTLYGEDCDRTGIFTYRLKGFANQPTDHYVNTLFKEAENGNPDKFVTCFGSEGAHKDWFRYGKEFLESYKDIGTFMLLHHGSLSHDDLNQITLVDDDFSNLLEFIKSQKLLENTVLIVMADHGARFSRIRNTQQGQLEERLPFFSIVLPDKFRYTGLGQKIYSNLVANKNKLTTPYDVHATLLDILDIPKDVDVMQSVAVRSHSMFRPIPGDRTCTHAGIEPHWCTCLQWEDAQTSFEERLQVRFLSRALTEAIDSQLVYVRHLCATVSWRKTISAKKLIPNKKLSTFGQTADIDGNVPVFNSTAKTNFAHYQLEIETRPNNARYQATVFFNKQTEEMEVDLMSISHVNPYGSDPHCVIDDHYALAQFCVCHDKVRK